MSGLGEVIDAIVRAVPAHQPGLSSGEIDRLRELTGELLRAKPDATSEYARFLSIRQRGLCLPEAQLTERLAGATIMVTGGTG